MSTDKHRSGVNEINCVERSIKVAGMTPDNATLVLAEIDRLQGMDQVSFDASRSEITVVYDAAHCNIHLVENKIHECGFRMAKDWWSRVKESYYEFVDQNVKDNASHEPWSCHNPPPTKKKK